MSDQAVIEFATRQQAQRSADVQPLWRMTVGERIAAMRRGELTYRQCCAWAARHPEQVPLLNGEWEFLAARTPEACE